MKARRKSVGEAAPPATRSAARAERTRTVIEGRVIEVQRDDNVVFVTGAGQRLVCRCPQHVDPAWLRAALKLGAVAAEASVSSAARLGTVWCLLPTPEQRKVVAESLSLAASCRVDIVCGKSQLQLRKDGTVRLRGRDVMTRGSRVARVLGGSVRLN
jgi:hypothetical protein